MERFWTTRYFWRIGVKKNFIILMHVRKPEYYVKLGSE
jgi:hypothetical protein